MNHQRIQILWTAVTGRRWRATLACSCLLAGLLIQPTAGQSAASGESEPSPEAVIRELYDLITFDAGTTPNWDSVRALFIDEAVVVLRTSATGTTIFSLDGFIGDFTRFAARDDVQQAGFQEKILRLRPWAFGDIAHVLVLYQAHIPGSPREPRAGVDSFQLVRRDGAWRIASVTNEVTTPELPVPPPLAH